MTEKIGYFNGIPISEMSRERLMDVIIYLCKQLKPYQKRILSNVLKNSNPAPSKHNIQDVGCN